MLSCLCLGKGITGAQLLSGVERVRRCCAPALPWPLVCPIPLCPKGKLALPEASKRYFPSMAKHQGRFESALPQCLSVNGNGFGVFFLPRMPRVSLCCCWAVELTPQELRAVRNRTLVLMEPAFLKPLAQTGLCLSSQPLLSALETQLHSDCGGNALPKMPFKVFSGIFWRDWCCKTGEIDKGVMDVVLVLL